MAGSELLGKEELKELSVLFKTGILARYSLDQERKGIWKVRDFERAFAKYFGSAHALGVSSGSCALKVALTALDVGPGDEVICPAFTFMATYEAVLEVGGMPVMADIDDTLNLDPEDIPNKITPRTKAIIPVHMCGAPARMDKIMKVARKYKLLVLEDNAQACGASIRGKYTGTFGQMGIFSFDHYKTITTGEGGWADRCRVMRLHGISKDAWKRYTAEGSWYYEIVAPGFKYNLTDIAAAMGLAQLGKAERMLRRREAIARRYGEAFGAMPELELPRVMPWAGHAWQLYLLRLNAGQLKISRAQFIEELKARKIGSSVHFIPLHVHPYYRERYGYRPEDYPVAYGQYQRVVSLPIYSKMTDQDVEDVVDAVVDIVNASRR